MEDLVAARLRFEAQIPGWTTPVAQGTALVRPGDDPEAIEFSIVNTSAHRLPVVVLGLVVGRVDQTATYAVSADQLDQAIGLIAPAAAATWMEHPNLAAWRAMQQALHGDPTATVVTVFVADLADPSSGPYDDALRAQLAASTEAG